MSPITGIGIVGCGEIVRTRHLPALREIQGCRIVAFADNDPNRLDLMRRTYPADNYFSDYRELLSLDSVDLVAICGPPSIHVDVAIEGLQAGKHVFIEKPLSLSLDACDGLIKSAQRFSGKVMVGYNQRWHVLTQQARLILGVGKLGKILAVRSVFTTRQRRAYQGGWRAKPDQGGDLLNDLGVHHFDLVTALLNRNFSRISASYYETGNYTEIANVNAELDDGISVSSQFISGAPEQNVIEIIGVQGRLVLDFYRFDGLEIFSRDVYPGSLAFRLKNFFRSLRQTPQAIVRMRQGDDYFLSYRSMWMDFLDCVQSGRDVDFDLTTSCKATQTALAAWESTHTGRIVEVGHAPRSLPLEIQTKGQAESIVTGAPVLSAIVVVPGKINSLFTTLNHLAAQTIAEKIEIILVAPGRQGLDVDRFNFAPFFSTKVVEVGKIQSIAQAYATGIRHAQAPLVVLTEDHSYPERDWAQALVKAHMRPWAAAGPMMLNANPDSSVSWADFYIAYGEWADHQLAYPVSHLPGHNSCYKRDILLKYGDRLGDILEAESVLHWDLRAQGHELLLETAAKTHHLNFSLWSIWIPVQYYTGRMFAATRSQNWSVSKRMIFALASPLIPLVRLRRIHRHIRRAHERSFFFKLLPVLLVGLGFDGLGQGTGYAFGAGNSIEKAADYEFNRVLYIREPLNEP